MVSLVEQNTQAQPTQATPLPGLLTRNHPVLIVEDELSLQTTLNHVLLHLDPQISPIWVRTFGEAVDKIRDENFDLIIADYQLMDSGTGLDLWAFCRRRCPKVPFMLMSAMGVGRYLNIVAGIHSPPPFLPKPFRLSECRQAILGLLYDRNEPNPETLKLAS